MFIPAFPLVDQRGRQGRVTVEHAAPGVSCCRVTGHGDEEVAQAILRGANSVLRADGRLHIFHDWMGVTGYSPGARKVLTDWSLAHSSVPVTMLFQSQLLAMGVAVAGLAVPGLVALHDPVAFAAARDAALAGPDRPLSPTP